MRRILFVSMTVALVSFLIVPSVFAAKFKVPKEACYTLEGGGPLNGASLILAFKSSGLKVKIEPGSKKFYTMQGLLMNEGEYWNVTGSGIVIDDEAADSLFDGGFSGLLLEDVVHCNYFSYSEGGISMTCKMASDGFTVGSFYNLSEDEEGCKGIEFIN